MNTELLQQLIEYGYADDAGIAADVTEVIGGKQYVLCVNGELVTLASGNPPQKVFRDSIDKFGGIKVKSGVFKKTLSFTHSGTDYAFAVKNGKTLLQYFKLLAE